MEQAPKPEPEEEKQHVPMSWDQIKKLIEARARARQVYDGHRTGKGMHTKSTMSKEERRKKRREKKKRRKANRK
jgi:hypothetical protein